MPQVDLLSIFFGTVAAGWFFYSFVSTLGLRDMPSFSRVLRETAPTKSRPSVTVVVAARNERDRIGESVRRILAQQGVDLELNVVDDRSDDGTREILEQLAAEEPRLRLFPIDELPAEWLGKQHACHIGSQQARGDWILFTDADTWMNKTLIADAVRVATAQRIGLVCLLPLQQGASIAGRAAMLGFSLGLVAMGARANRDRRFSPVGIGAFNLVNAELYRKSGGYERLRMEVIDDVKLGLLVQRVGGRLRCWTAETEAEMDWAATPAAMVRALEKNFFAMANLHYGIAALMFLTMATGWAAAIVGPWTGRWSGYAAAAGLLSVALPAALFARRSGWGWLSALLVPIIYPILPWTLFRSAWLAWRQGGIRWRDTLYPLEQLRRHRVRLF